MFIFPVVACFTLCLSLYAALKDDQRLYFIFKSGTSALFILTAWFAGLDGNFATLLFLGIVMHAVGDVLIIKKEGKILFLASVGFFLAGHILYFLAFSQFFPLTEINPLALSVALFCNMGIYLMIRGRLGSMLIVPGAIYALAMSLMTASAITVFVQTDLPVLTRSLIVLGALVYNISDYAVLREVFIKKSPFNKLWGLPLYYAAQFTLAFSLLASHSGV